VSVEPNAVDGHVRTALHYACLGNKASIARRLVAERRCLCARDADSYGFRPLMYAAMKRGAAALVRAIIDDAYQGLAVHALPGRVYDTRCCFVA